MRVHSCLRNRQPGSEGGPGGAQPGRAAAIALGDLTIDPESRQACARGRRLDLTAKEFDILLLLAQRPNTVFTRQQILDSVWGYGHHGNTGVVAVKHLFFQVMNSP
ncbi:MAG: winged helix-turn-helix domain-containing protein [Slackia sp.]|nr:winged helix-turn-helix domain-containing protein [Slackia sp.]